MKSLKSISLKDHLKMVLFYSNKVAHEASNMSLDISFYIQFSCNVHGRTKKYCPKKN